jgi:mono/diheme cytochrome c family protein
MNLQTNSSTAALAALLLSACSDPIEPQVYPETGSPSAQLFQTKCTGCHIAPQPNAHTEPAWFRVVHRMQMRMKERGVMPLNQTELDDVLDYLQRHAATVESK